MRRTRKSGGRKIGEGKFGAVFSPPLKCQEGNDDKWASGEFVSKTIYEGALEKEYRNSFLVRMLDPEGIWSITAEHACTIHKTQRNANYIDKEPTHQLIFKNGGRSLYDLLLKPGVKGDADKYILGLNDDGEEDSTVFSKLHPKGLTLLIGQLQKFLPYLELLNKKYVHGDLHFGNIVSDGVNPKVIDFSSLRSLDDKIAYEKKSYNRCLTFKKDKCAWLEERIGLCIEDDAKSRDTLNLWSELYRLLDSAWVNKTFPGKYTAWLAKYENLSRFMNFCPDYILSIMNVPL